MKKQILDETEREVEESMSQLSSVGQEKKARIEKILSKERKDRAISLRIRTYDLEKIKEKAEQTGVPYQTLITTVLHKYVTDQLYDKDEVLKTLKLVTGERRAM